MKTAPSEELQGVAEEIVQEVDVDENKIIGDPNAPNKDTNTIVKVVVTGEHVTIPSDLRKIFSEKVHLVTNTIVTVVTDEDVTTPREEENKNLLSSSSW